MPDLFDNPMGVDSFEFVEFSSPAPGVLEPLIEKLGFTKLAVHCSKDVALYREGGINFIVNSELRSLAWYFAAGHGPSACAMAFACATRTRHTDARGPLAPRDAVMRSLECLRPMAMAINFGTASGQVEALPLQRPLKKSLIVRFPIRSA